MSTSVSMLIRFVARSAVTGKPFPPVALDDADLAAGLNREVIGVVEVEPHEPAADCLSALECGSHELKRLRDSSVIWHAEP
jgi:hypothetical protein